MENNFNEENDETNKGRMAYQSPYSQDLETLLEEDRKRIDEVFIRGQNNKKPVPADNSKTDDATVNRKYSPYTTSALDSLYQRLEDAGPKVYDALSGFGSSLKKKATDVYDYRIADGKGLSSFYQKLKSGGSQMYGRFKKIGSKTKAKVSKGIYGLLQKRMSPAGSDDNKAAPASVVNQKGDGLSLPNELKDALPCSMTSYLLNEDELPCEEPCGGDAKEGNKHKPTSRHNSEKYRSLRPIKRVKLPDGRTAYFIKNNPPVDRTKETPAVNAIYGIGYSITMTYNGNQMPTTSYTFSTGFALYQ